MGLYFCPNCRNLKIRTLKRRDLKGLSKYKIMKAIKESDTDSLGLPFPISIAVYKRLSRIGHCEIIYCDKNMLSRVLYIYRDGLEGSLTPNKHEPCPKYR
jgi:hypothetical protein